MESSRKARLRLWAGRGAVVVAAFAVIATSPARWSIAADPVTVPPAPSSATLVTVEASQLPSVSSRTASGEWAQVPPLDVVSRTAWPGRADYLVPVGQTFDAARITGICENQGMCTGSCGKPAGAFVRIAHIESVSEWRVDVDSEPQTATVAQEGGASFTVVLDATRRVDVTVKALGTDAQVAQLDPPGVYDDAAATRPAEGASATATKIVSWRMRWDVPQGTPPITLQWVAHATMRGYCRGPSDVPCVTPATEHLRIVSIAPRAAQ